MPTSPPVCPIRSGHLADPDLVDRVRTGDADCFAELYRRHRPMAGRVARRAGVSLHDVDDVVAEAFAKVLRAVRGGRGPTENFTGYLATAVKRVAWSAQEDSERCRPTDDLAVLDTVSEAVPEPLADSVAGAAFAALPEPARSLLWRVEVDGDPVREIARELGRSPNSVSAAACRARSRLRSEYALRLGA